MREKLEQRLEQLKSEFEAGKTMLTELEQRQATLRDTLLRISGAIQVLEEALNEFNSSEAASNGGILDETATMTVDATH